MAPTSYINRPNKGYVRSELVRLVGVHTDASVKPQDYCYVSLGSYRFLDLLEIYHLYRIRSLYSIEREAQLYKRAEFNCPFPWIMLHRGQLPDFLARFGPSLTTKKKILFLDYTTRLSDEILQEMDSLFLSDFFASGGLFYLTVNVTRETPYLIRVAPRQFQTQEDFEGWIKGHIPLIVREKVRARFGGRKDTREIAKFAYRDTSPMGVFAFKIADTEQLGQPYATREFDRIDVPDVTPIEQHTIRRRGGEGPARLSEITGMAVEDIEFFLKHD